MGTSSTGKKNKRPDTRPARKRYWDSGSLRKHKVRNLVKSNGLTEKEATEFWVDVRKGRKK